MKPQLIPAIILLAAACSGDDGDLVGPGTGSLDISVATTGQSTATGYTVSLDGGAAEAIGLNGSVHRDGVSAGQHTVLLAGLPEGCTVAGDNPRSVAVEPAGTASLVFAVSCATPVGRIDVVTQTSGPGPANYTLVVDGVTMGPVAAAATRTLEGVTVGAHSVGLSDVPANCQLQGDNPQAITVQETAPVTVTFALTCAAPPAETGALKVTTATTGSDPDDDGYQLTIEGVQPQPIAASGSVTVAGLGAGAHAVQLSGVAANCSVVGDNPRTVTVVGEATADVAFSITCAAAPGTGTTGSIRISTATTGSSLDPDGYTYKLDDRAPASIGASATVTLADLAAGDHFILIEGVASNCTLAGANPRSVGVTAGNTAEASFTVTCEAGNAQQWTQMTTNTTDNLLGVWAGPGSDAFAVSSGSIFHYNGASWSRQAPAPAGAALRAVWGSSATDVFAVGAGEIDSPFPDGVILHYDGAAWTPMQPPSSGSEVTQGFYLAVSGSSASDVYAVGNFDAGFTQALAAHFDGTAWSRVTLPMQDEHSLRDVFSASATDVWIGGVIVAPSDAGPGYGFVFHYNGSEWSYTNVFEEFGLRGIWASSPTNAFTVGQLNGKGAVFHTSNGTTWTRMAVPDTGPLNDVWGSSETDVYAAGDNGILHYDGTAWSVVASAGFLNDIWGASASDIFAVGAGGTIYHGPR